MSSEKNELYTTIKLPKEFMEMIDTLVDDSKLGFTSRAEVVKTAVREYVIKLKDSGMVNKQ